jgi:hypothetical protein
MRDLFVAGLCITGFLLATYLAGRRTLDFWLSLVAGVTVVGVVFFPTSRPSLADEARRCGTSPEPAGCSAVQQWLGEGLTAGIHFGCALVFIVSLAWIAFRFAKQEQSDNHRTKARVQWFCGFAIIGAIGWVAVGGLLDLTVWELTPLYVGEVAAVWAFGVSWLLTSRDLERGLLQAAEREQATT